jgi:probable HAF family extracellular repeat protein
MPAAAVKPDLPHPRHRAARGAIVESLEPRQLLSAYTITPLQPAGYTGFLPKAINASGTIAGDLVNAAGAHFAATCSPAGAFALLNVGGVQSFANAINSSGQVAGSTVAANGVSRGFLYTNGQSTPLNPLPGGANCDARGINAAGQVVGASNSPNGDRAVRYAPDGTPTNLGVVDYGINDSASYANAINNLGLIVGDGSYLTVNLDRLHHGFVADATGGMSALPNLPGGTETNALAINDAGQVAGWALTSAADQRAFVISDGIPYNLGTLGSPYYASSLAVGINDELQVVGSSISESHFSDPFLFTAGQLVQLSDLLPPASGWDFIGDQLQDANGNVKAINDRGQIVGYASLNGTLTGYLMTPTSAITGPLASNTFYIRKNADNAHVDVWTNTTPGNAPPTQYVLGSTPTFQILGGSGADAVTLDLSNGNPFAYEGLYFDGAGGVNTLKIIGTSSDDTITANATSLRFVGGAGGGTVAPVAYNNLQGIQFVGGSGGNDTLNVTQGNFTIDASTDTGTPNVSVNVSAGAAVTFATDQRLAALNLNGGSASIISATPRTLNTAALSITGATGKLDLGSSKLLTNTAAATIRTYLLGAYTANQDWSGATGITSTRVAANPTLYTIGYANGNDPSTQDAGIAVSPGQTLVCPTLTGDANLDGKVNFFDISQLLGYKYNTTQPASYTDGDLDYSGKVDFFDLSLILSANYNSGAVFSSAGAPAAVTPAASEDSLVVAASAPARSVFSSIPLLKQRKSWLASPR